MEDNTRKISRLAGEILKLAHDDILIHLRFFDVALSKIHWKERPLAACIATDGNTCFYDPVFLLKGYRSEPHFVTRCYLHVLLHCIFAHTYGYQKLDRDLWNMAADIAVENVILDLGLSGVGIKTDSEAMRKIAFLKGEIGALTAEKLYRYFKNTPPSETERAELRKLFYRDAHELWESAETEQISLADWKKISERIKADLKSFSARRPGSESLEKNLEETTRDRYDYAEILQKFTVRGEDITVNDEEFDYIYYTYGLEQYGNLPLIEPLEYKEIKKVREFVIAIDTSASCRGSVVQAFLRKTYSILKASENFFHRVNIHIIQCDNEVRSDTKITCDEDFESFMKYGKLTGFSATDFRPVFTYVDRLIREGEFEDLKGLIYFTDGYGIYPEKMPAYDVIFAFLGEDEHRMPVPPWSLQVILEEEL